MVAECLFDDGRFGASTGLTQQIETALQQGNDAAIARREKFETQGAATLEVGKGFSVAAQRTA